jgi:hypothetical protein
MPRNNVLAYSPENDIPIAAVWDSGDLVGTGRLAVVMDVNWLDKSWGGRQTFSLAQNLAFFLSGLPAPPAAPVAPFHKSTGTEIGEGGGEETTPSSPGSPASDPDM